MAVSNNDMDINPKDERMVKTRSANFWALPIRFKVFIFLEVVIIYVLGGFAWNQYKASHPRTGFIVPEPSLSSTTRTKFSLRTELCSSISFSCELPSWAKTVEHSREITSTSGALVNVGLLPNTHEEQTDARRFIQDLKTNSGFDDDRVYAGSWVGLRRSEPMEVDENGKKCLYQNYGLQNPEYWLNIYLIWPKGNAKAKEDAQEILASVVYSIREEK